MTTRTLVSVTILLASAMLASAQPTNNSNPTQSAGTATNTAQAVQINNVVSDPRWAATVPVGQMLTVNFRILMSDGTTTSDFRNTPLVFQVFTSDGTRLTAAEVSCRPEIGQCKLSSSVARVVYLSTVIMGRGLGYASLVINFYRQNHLQVETPTIAITSSQVQANDGTTPALVLTSPIASPGPVVVKVHSNFTNDGFSKEIYLADGVEMGQRIMVMTEEVRPLSFRDMRNFEATMTGPMGYVIAQGFGSSSSSTEVKFIDAAIDDNSDLVFTVSQVFDPAVDYSFSILRGDKFRIDLSTVRGELFAYAYGNKTRVVFNKGSLLGNRFELPVGSYTISMAARDRSTGIGWTRSRADALDVEGTVVLK